MYPGPILGTGNSTVIKIPKVPPHEAYILGVALESFLMQL